MESTLAFTGPVRHVYVHVPFCTARCDYCDFASEEVGAAGSAEPVVAALFDRYVDAVTAEWERERAAHGVRRLTTLYLGGGTPALLGAARLERLVSAFAPWLTSRAEVTVETNPDEVTEAFAGWAARRDVRVSLGVQSFLPRLRRTLGRRPTADPAAAARRLRAAGVRDLAVDLIHGITGQTVVDVDADLRAVAQLAPDHVSWYELEVAEGTRLARRLRSDGGRRRFAVAGEDGRIPPNAVRSSVPALPGEDARAALYRHVVRGIERLGYRWYEVSNFARPGRRARHNAAYWRARPYLGLGAGAVSTVGASRWRNVPDVSAYVRCLTTRAAAGAGDAGPGGAGAGSPLPAPPRELETLDEQTLARERLLLAARCGLAIPLAEVSAAVDADALAPLGGAGLLSLHSGTIRVTRKGRYVANEVCVRLFRA